MARVRTSSVVAVAAVALCLLIAEQPAYAYIDPGSGSLLYQAALTLLLGAGFFFRRTFSSIGRLFRGRGHEAPGASDRQGPDHR